MFVLLIEMRLPLLLHLFDSHTHTRACTHTQSTPRNWLSACLNGRARTLYMHVFVRYMQKKTAHAKFHLSLV